MPFRRVASVGHSILLSLLLPGMVIAQPAAQGSANPGYVLGANDEIDISVYGQPDLSVHTRIKSDGTIVMPLIGTVTASGLSPAALGQELAQRYKSKGYLTNPQIGVEVSNYVSQSATVLGNVLNAGNYPLDHDYSIASIVARAGGIRQDGANAVILTPADGTGAVRISLMDLRGGAARIVKPGDTIFVPAAEMVYVYGQVNTPGAVPYQPDITYRQALARAGGPTLAGSTRSIEVRRAGKKLSHIDLDEKAQPEDVLIIKEKLF